MGGAVRDAILGHQSKDIDIEIHDTTDKARVFSELRTIGHVDERGAFFGVLASRIDGQDFDISFPRSPSLSSIDAFSQRDFTINALGYNPGTGELIDPFNGIADLERKIVRHTSDAFLFSGKPVYVQRQELEDARTLDDYTIRQWVDAAGVNYVEVDGELELLPGVRLLPAPGHTRGSQIVVVETANGPVVIAGDTAVWFGELDAPGTEGQRLIRSLHPYRVWLAHSDEPWSAGS
ncbi:hypothetical protein [Subtercola endophyticus]|uniref:hypothetical protein n=1 Tax=Subtercola endophyticus TaxID=2895559 RepID=UPI001E4FEB7D|nr:hypothetical protein [Subtercola endophyticus]UFS57614.1 hypothetical protein LQ955_11135 [Subtercola endophyticus]